MTDTNLKHIKWHKSASPVARELWGVFEPAHDAAFESRNGSEPGLAQRAGIEAVAAYIEQRAEQQLTVSV